MPYSASGLWRWQHPAGAAVPLSLSRIDFADIPGWACDDHAAALACYLNSVARSASPLPRPGRDIRARDAAREFFERHFEACRILVEPGLLTSYFEPVLEGSRQPSPAFPIPVYRRPDDLEPLPDGHCLRERGLTAGQRAGEDFRPYFTRAEIEAGAIAGRGLELLYVSDPIMAFVMHVQGSGAVNLAEGGTVRLSFDGKNGHPYTSVGKLMIERGALSLEEASLERVMDWLRRHPGQSGALLAENKSYIFFKELEEGADAPQGSLGCPLFPGRSLAVDPRYHALGLPIWVSAPQLNYEGQAFRRLMVAQDTGSAISGPQRGDLFAGSGVEAGAIAGRVRQSCEFIVLRPR